MTTFEELHIEEHILNAIKKKHITEPTKIQEKSIPLILEGKDVLGESATGSGKTLAFGVGLLQNTQPQKGLQALVLTPTREIAQQVTDVLHDFSGKQRRQILSVYGGVSINPQIDKLHSAEIVVGTPGRILDHLERGTIDFSQISLLVLDEADKMFEMGFIDDIARIISQMPKKRQTLLFSATFSKDVERIAKSYMTNPERVKGDARVDPSKLAQFYYQVPQNMKFSILVHLLKQEDTDLTLVFCNTKRMVDSVTKSLCSQGIKAKAVHGGLTQAKRTKSLDDLKKSKITTMVCTDVAARGLDIPDVSHVYNYDIPNDPNDYVHRSGRTARAGKAGKVINILARNDYDNFGKILHTNKNINPTQLDAPEVENVPLLRGDSGGDRRGGRGNSRGGRDSRDGRGSRGSSRGSAFGKFRKDDDRPRRNDRRDSSQDSPRRSFGDRNNDSTNGDRPMRRSYHSDSSRGGDRSDSPRRSFGGSDRSSSRDGGRSSSPRRSFGGSDRSSSRDGGRSSSPRRSFGGSDRSSSRDSGRSSSPRRSFGGSDRSSSRDGGRSSSPRRSFGGSDRSSSRDGGRSSGPRRSFSGRSRE